MGRQEAEFVDLYHASRDDCQRAVLAVAGDPHLSEGLAADAFAKVWASWRGVRPHPAPRAWIVRTVLNTRISWWQRRREVPLDDHDGTAAGGGLWGRRRVVKVATMPVTDLPSRYPAEWTRATRHPFLDAVATGELDRAAFDAWLVQDYLFVADLLRMQARLLARAPRVAQPVLAAGAAALVDELAWFERHAAGRRLDLRVGRLAATAGYARLLDRLDQAPADIALAMLWALERVYLDAWSSAAPGAPGYQEFVAHWTTPEFAGYVAGLATAADAVLAGDPAGTRRATGIDQWFLEVAAAEAAFWDMALTGPAA